MSGPYVVADNASFCAKQPYSFFFSRTLGRHGQISSEETALMISAYKGHLEICKALVENKADVDAKRSNE